MAREMRGVNALEGPELGAIMAQAMQQRVRNNTTTAQRARSLRDMARGGPAGRAAEEAAFLFTVVNKKVNNEYKGFTANLVREAFDWDNDFIKKEIAKFEPEIQNWSQQNPRFDFLIMDATALNVVSHDGKLIGIAGSDPQPQEQQTPYPVTIQNATHIHLLDLTVTSNHNTAIMIQHTDSGANLTVYVNVLKSDKV